MNLFLLYLLKVNCLLPVWFLFYRLFLRRNTFFTCNRFYFIAVWIISLVLPATDFSVFFRENSAFVLPLPVVPDIRVSGASTVWNIENYILLILCLGMAVFAVRLGIQVFSLLSFRKQARHGVLHGTQIYLMSGRENPFSFFRWIFVNPACHEADELLQIIMHERVHARQFHTLDVILYECLSALCWYNPFIWLMKQDVMQNIEYITDREMLQTGFDRYKYQHNLLKTNQIQFFPKIATNFNIHCLKNRIIMMNKAASGRTQLLKYMLLAPLCVFIAVVAGVHAEIMPPGNLASHPETAASAATIAFDRNEHNFGAIRESDGKASTVFSFVNRGDKPLLISDVKASCGCPTPEWTKEPVAPGQKGYIRATYDPTGRIYVFERTLTVYSNGFPAKVTLRIKGETIGKNQ
jgi:hypothetical protein